MWINQIIISLNKVVKDHQKTHITMTHTSIDKTILDIALKLSAKEVSKKFALYFFIGFIILVSWFAIIIQIEYRQSLEIQKKEQIHKLRLINYMIQHDLETLASDLLILANNETLQEYLQPNSHVNKVKLQNRFLLFVRDRKVYDQARFLDNDGNEVIRVNMGKTPEVVGDRDLQNKKDRYYFKETVLLQKDEIFVSPLDLNVEKGKIQTPYLPVIRVGTPVFDNQNNPKGVVIINFNATTILNHYSYVLASDKKQNFSIINEDGFWIKSHDPTLEWGFMFGNNNTLQKQNPKLWNSIIKLKQGQILLPDGLFTFITIHPDATIRSGYTHSGKKTGEHAWHVIIKTPKRDLSYMHFFLQHAQLIWVLPLLFFLLVGVSIYLAVLKARKTQFDRSQTLLSTSIEQSPAAIVITDIEGNIIYANPKFERMSGYQCSDVLGDNPRVFKSGNTPDKIYAALWKTVLHGNVWRGNFENKHKNGTPYYVSAQIAPILGPKKKIEYLLSIQEDVTEKVALQKELEKMATYDSLTGVLNRGQFLQLGEKELKKVNRYNSSAAMMVLDLDHFKNVNDSYGHHIGDLVLIKFVECIQNELRDSDLVGRLGGEEFAALVFESNKKSTFQLAERLRLATENMVIQTEYNDIKITVSIGFTLLKQEDEDINEAIKRADDSLYIAKEKGRNRTEFFE